MLLTLAEAKESSLDVVAGSCPDSATFLRLLNEATRRLMRRGDWYGTVVPIQVCTIGGCIVWPRYVDHIRKMNVCNRPVEMRNTWYTFLEFDGPSRCNGYNWGAGGNWWGSASWGRWMGQTAYAVGGVETPVFQDVMGDGRFIRFYPVAQADLGKTVTVFGVDNNNNTLRHKLSDGTWEDGWVVTLANPYGSTADYVRRIDRLIFEDHESTIRAYAYNAADDVLEDIGLYEGHDNNPTFTRYNLSTSSVGGATCGSGSCGTDCIKSVVALAKLRFIPARYETDLVLIDNISALKLMFQCIKYEEAGDRPSARAAELDAIRELNLDLNDAYPVEQTPIGNGVLGGTGLGLQRMF